MRKILVVEDEVAIREFVVINLKRAGYETVEAGTGEEALDIFFASSDFQVVLLDVMMPGIDGLAVCKQIRETNPTVGIIMLTAKSQEMDKVSALMMGADDYMTKPFSPTELVARVDSLNRRVEMLNSKTKKEITDEIQIGEFSLNLRRELLLKEVLKLNLHLLNFKLLNIFSLRQVNLLID